MKTILVAGGCGFIGSNLCIRLLNENNKIICIDNLFSGKIENIKTCIDNNNFTFINHNIIEPLHINNEIDELVFLLEKIPEIVEINGRVCIISFHSIEDRIVKIKMRGSRNSVSRTDQMTAKQYAFFSGINHFHESSYPKIKQVKRILPTKEEIKINIRSRSAVLRELVN